MFNLWCLSLVVSWMVLIWFLILDVENWRLFVWVNCFVRYVERVFVFEFLMVMLMLEDDWSVGFFRLLLSLVGKLRLEK